MKSYVFAIVGLFLSFSVIAGPKEKIDPDLLSKFESSSMNSVLIVMKEQGDVSLSKHMMTKLDKAKFVISKLQNIARTTQGSIIRVLADNQINYKSFYITNSIQATIDIELLYKIASMDEVKIIINDADTPMPILRNSSILSSVRAGEPEWGIRMVKADSVWLQGYRGEGVIVGGQDTGYDFDNDLLIGKYRGVTESGIVDHNYSWHDAIHEINPFNVDSSLVGIDSLLDEIIYVTDTVYMDTTILSIDTIMIDSVYMTVDSLMRGEINPCGLDSDFPCDDNSHGTHTMGTMVGGDTTDIIGVAPDAKWIACRNMERGWGKPSTYIECFEWFMSPTDLNGQNADPSKAPHVINNSWGCPPVEGCNIGNFSIMDNVVNNLKASGVVVVVSAGNSGSGCETISNPSAMFEGSFTVGATRQNDTIAGFSSRGLVTSDSSFRMKPNISAPGVGVRSCTPGNNFRTYSGTSMAGPHVAGVVALMISANPSLAGHVNIIEDIIEETADPKTSDQDCSGVSSLVVPNPVYGYGRINAYKAVELALNTIIESNVDITKINTNIELYPNPVIDELNLFVNYAYVGQIVLQVYNTNGSLAKEITWDNKGLISHTLNLKSLIKGVYLCKLNFDNQSISKKIIKI